MPMEHKIAVSIESDIVKWIDSESEKGKFRSRSHGFEYCARIVKDREFNSESQQNGF